MNYKSASFKALGSEDQAEVRAKHNAQSKSKALKAKYRGNTRSEGGIPFGKAPKGEK